MLKPTSQNAKFCYDQALEAEQRAENAQNWVDRNFWQTRQRHWLAMAASYDYTERIAAFVANLRQRHRQPVCAACHVPMRIRQLRCRDARATEYQYECPACEIKQTIVEIDTRPPSA